MKNSLLWLFAAILSVTISSCSKDEEPVIEIPKEFSELTFEEGTNVLTVKFEANQSWEVFATDTKADEVSWLTISPLKGSAGNATITLTAQDNFSRDPRNTYLKISIDGLVKTVPVTQLAGITVIEDDKPTAAVQAKGFYVVNEDWFGHDNGTVNFFQKEGNGYTASYRAYRAANPSESDWFGASSQHATIWGDYAYFSSKQGNRFVVADAKSLQKKAVITELGGDGRSFVGVDDTKGYVGHGKGMVVFDIKKLQLGKQIEGVNGQIGTMGYSRGRVFAVSQQNGLYVINAETDVLEETIAGSFNTLAVSKDGNVWVAGTNNFVKINPLTLEKEEVAYPDGAKIGNTWGAWNAGSLCAATQQNVLYWSAGGGMFGGGNKVVKYDIDTQTANTELFAVGTSEFGTQLEFYGAGLRVDPLTDELILTVKHSGWGASGAYNWIYKIDANGREITNFKVKGDNGSGASWGGNAEDWDGKYFWFPAMPFFEDANKPQILTNQIIVKAGESKEVNLAEKIIDYDNTEASILKTVVSENSDLATVAVDGNILTVTAGNNPGKTSATVTVISNGVRVNKTVRIDIEK